MSSTNQHHNGLGDNVDTKNIFNINIKIDVFRLKLILDNESKRIKNIFSKIDLSKENDSNPDERTISIHKKNKINNLEEFYSNFIKIEEGKLFALDKFFQENDYMDAIESAANNLKIMIFSKGNRNTLKLDANLLNEIIQDHCMVIPNTDDKDIMTLIIYYLYRYCYIGEKMDARYIKTHRSRNIKHSVLFISKQILVMTSTSKVRKLNDVYVELKNQYLLSEKDFMYALNFLFIIGTIKYNKDNDTLVKLI